MLMSRREMREQIFKLLFRVEFNQREEMPEQSSFPVSSNSFPARKFNSRSSFSLRTKKILPL